MKILIPKAFPATLIGLLCLFSPVFATADSIPAAPKNLVSDGGRILSPQQSASLSQLLAAIRDEGTITLYLVTKYYVPDEKSPETTKGFVDAWITGSPGLVILYSRGNDRISISGNEEMEELFTRAEIRGLIEKAIRKGGSNPDLDASGRLFESVSFLSTFISDRLKARVQNAESARHSVVSLGWIVGVAGLVLAVFAWVTSWAIARKLRRKNDFTYFPSVDVGERFGAPFGGGIAAQIADSQNLSPPSSILRNAPAPGASKATDIRPRQTGDARAV